MTTQTAAVSLGALDTAIAAATGQLGDDQQRLAVAVFRPLSAGAAELARRHATRFFGTAAA